jgi:hypothetical protein
VSGISDYESYDAIGLAQLVRRGRVTPHHKNPTRAK